MEGNNRYPESPSKLEAAASNQLAYSYLALQLCYADHMRAQLHCGSCVWIFFNCHMNK